MNSKTIQTKDYLNPRTEAEKKLAGTLPNASLYSAEDLLHELQVHQIELEMQNEELQRALAALDVAHHRYLDLYEFAPVGYLTLSSNGEIIEINLTATTMLNVDRNDLLNHQFSNYIAPQNADNWYKKFRSMLAQKTTATNLELMLKRGDSEFYARLDCLVVINDKIPTLRITLTDITEKKRIEEELRIAAVAFDAQEGIMITNADKVVFRINKAFTDITGYSAEELIGHHPPLFKSVRHHENFYNEIWECVNSNGFWEGEIWDRRKDGEIYPQWLTITAVKDDKKTTTHYVYLHNDISSLKASEEVIKQLAFYDPLTSLPNRRLLLDRLQQALAASARSEKYGALLFIDLDNFKSLNDDLGHDMGDVLLEQVAQRLVACVREGDTVSRQGGDEFVIMMEELSEHPEEAAAKAKTIGEKILTSLNQSYQLLHREYQNTPSIGITLFIDHLHTINALMKRADIAMYEAKSAGRNTLRFYDQRMQEAVTARAALEKDLRCALEKKEFELYFQRQECTDGSTVGAEVLLRWNHPERGLILPAQFIPLAEEIGLIIPIGLWVLSSTCAQLRLWKKNKQTRKLRLAVNISARQFHQTNFNQQLCTLLKKNTISADRLILEFTESLVFQNFNDNIDSTLVKMQKLKAIGVSFSMDDFGTGYSSLYYLAKLPFDQLKIDQSFVSNIGLKSTDTTIVQTIIGMTINLGMNIIAEGVETQDQRKFLELHGCQTYQGNLLGRPMPLLEFERSLNLN